MRGSGRDDAEFTEFVSQQSDRLYRSAYLLTTSPHAAEDLLQTTLAKAFAGARIRVEGNTDNVGNEAANKVLSQRRAQAVVDYLVNQHGMQRNRFIVVGNGPNNPVESNDTESGRSKNRRTDFELVED